MTTGTVMIFVSPEGRVIAHAADFGDGEQGLRCRVQLDAAVFKALCHPSILKAIDEYQRQAAVYAMERDGYRRHTITVEVPA
jgi:hypothetical protein